MTTWRLLTDPAYAGAFWPGVLAALAVGLACSLLSVLVVLRRMSFIGQGISHAAFGGVGVAALCGVLLAEAGLISDAGPGPEMLRTGVVLVFCLGSAGLIAWLTDRGSAAADTAIGIVLVGAMALGAVLLHAAYQRRPAALASWESVLFGSLLAVDGAGALAAWAAAAGVVAAAWWWRRPLLFWAFDPAAAPAFGVRGGLMQALLVLLVTVLIVVGMRLVGVVLATAMLVLPGATALVISDRLHRVLAAAAIVGTSGVALGVVASLELDWPPGPCLVLALVSMYVAARVWRWSSRPSGRATGAGRAPAAEAR